MIVAKPQTGTDAWRAFSDRVTAQPPWITVWRHTGPEEVKKAYAIVLGRRGDPRVGHILSLA